MQSLELSHHIYFQAHRLRTSWDWASTKHAASLTRQRAMVIGKKRHSLVQIATLVGRQLGEPVIAKPPSQKRVRHHLLRLLPEGHFKSLTVAQRQSGQNFLSAASDRKN